LCSFKEKKGMLQDIYKANLVISLSGTENNKLKVIKNRWGNTSNLDPREGILLISKIIPNIIFQGNDLMKLFSHSIKKEIIEKCTEILKKNGIKMEEDINE
jgi:hypothetical protein